MRKKFYDIVLDPKKEETLVKNLETVLLTQDGASVELVCL